MNQNKPMAVHPDSDSRQAIFVVDDEPMILELVVHILEPLGYHIRTFANPVDALHAFTLANPAPALILTDYNMQHMTGIDLIRECRRLNPHQKTILYSGTVDEVIYHNSPVKPNRFLAKPFLPGQLVDLAKEVLAEK
jgi:CheY-like chemotaxis protein